MLTCEAIFPRCSFGNCPELAKHKGLCSRHYYRQWRGIPMDTPFKSSKHKPAQLCPVEGCPRPVRKGGLCQGHYGRRKAGKDMSPPIGSLGFGRGGWKVEEYGPKPTSCRIPGCDRRVAYLRDAMCVMHYLRKRSGKDLKAPVRIARGELKEICIMDGCGKKANAKDLCSAHLYRLTKGHDLSMPFRRKNASKLGPGRWLDGSGYVMCKVPPGTAGAKPGGFMLEHRFVMQRRLGRTLLSVETVHHKDGNRTNNTIDNLELWSGKHGKGINIIDGIRSSTDWILRYGELDLADRATLLKIRDKAKRNEARLL